MSSATSLHCATLAAFVAEVNRLDRAAVGESDQTFGEEWFAMPEEMLAFYYNAGYSPAQVLEELAAEAAAELHFEALAS